VTAADHRSANAIALRAAIKLRDDERARRFVLDRSIRSRPPKPPRARRGIVEPV
jgi:hypothetical protein